MAQASNSTPRQRWEVTRAFSEESDKSSINTDTWASSNRQPSQVTLQGRPWLMQHFQPDLQCLILKYKQAAKDDQTFQGNI